MLQQTENVITEKTRIIQKHFYSMVRNRPVWQDQKAGSFLFRAGE